MSAIDLGRSALTRWVACAAIVVGAHAAAGVVAATWTVPLDSAETLGGAVVVELAPIETSPEASPDEVPPGPLRQQADDAPDSPLERRAERAVEDPKPVAVPEAREATEPVAALEAVATLPPEAKPEVSPRESRPSAPSVAVPVTSAPRPNAQRGVTASAPVEGQPTLDSARIASWKGRVVALLERMKRYPPEARARGEHGVVQAHFRIDRSGRVVASRITRGSGSAALDHEALALVQRAQPFPPPPDGLRGDAIDLTVPVRFDMR